jgi:hypothetical protein
MSKEIFTTDNMNEIVTPIYDAMKAGNPVAKLAFDLNDAINALKPGRPISKAERDRIEFMWDNLLVGLANEAVGDDAKGIAAVVDEAAKTEEIKFEDKYFESVLCKWYKSYKDMTTKDEENEEEGYSDASKLVILDGLTNMIKTKGTKDIAESLEISEDLIIEVIRRSEGAEDKFFEELKPANSLICVAESSYASDDDDDDDEEDENDTACDSKELEQKFIDALKKVFGNIDKDKCGAGCCNKPKSIRVKISTLDDLIDKTLKDLM